MNVGPKRQVLLRRGSTFCRPAYLRRHVEFMLLSSWATGRSGFPKRTKKVFGAVLAGGTSGRTERTQFVPASL